MADADKPNAPTMGGTTQLDKTEWGVWTGETPKPDWSGLDDKVIKEYTTPNQLCPIYASSAQKGYNFRKKGLEIKFKKEDDLHIFQNSVWKHLIDTGMDTTTYIPDPADLTKMVNIVKNHP